MSGFSQIDPFSQQRPGQPQQPKEQAFSDLFALADEKVKVTA